MQVLQLVFQFSFLEQFIGSYEHFWSESLSTSLVKHFNREQFKPVWTCFQLIVSSLGIPLLLGRLFSVFIHLPHSLWFQNSSKLCIYKEISPAFTDLTLEDILKHKKFFNTVQWSKALHLWQKVNQSQKISGSPSGLANPYKSLALI